jgi:hypothetical protein
LAFAFAFAFVGARLAGEGALKDVFAGKPGSYRWYVRRAFPPREHEAFVMKLRGLRPNAACLGGCRTFSDFAKVRFQTQSFT